MRTEILSFREIPEIDNYKRNISVERLIQIPDHKSKKASIIIITHKTNELDANKCLKLFKNNRNILKVPTRIRLF